MKAVVMAGGEGTRLRPVTCTRPKPMLKITGKPVIGHIIDLLIAHGFDEIAITVKYRAEDIEKYAESIETSKAQIYCIEEHLPLGTAGSVKNAASEWKEPFLVISGDCMCDMDLGKIMLYHKTIKAEATVVCVSVDDPREYGTLSMDKSGRIENFYEKPGWNNICSDLANTGIYVIEPSVLKMIPDGANYDFSGHLFPEMISSGRKLYGYHATGYWCDIGDLKSYRKCNSDMLSSKIKNPYGISTSNIMTPYGTENGNFSVIPPVYIGKNVSVGDGSVIGPYTVLDDDSSVGKNSRVKRSVVMSGASVSNNCDLIGTIIGESSVIKSSAVCLEGSCIGDGCIVERSSTVSNNILVWPGKKIPYRSVIFENLRDGLSEYDLIEEGGVKGSTFSELSCEKCCRIGEAVASSSCGGKVGIGYDSSKISKVVAMSVLSGLISCGSVVSDFGECFESQMRFFLSFASSDCGIYINATSETTEIKLFGKNGIPLMRKDEREIETRYKRGDFRRCCGNKLKSIEDMSSVSEVYNGFLLTVAGDKLSGSKCKISCENENVRYVCNKCLGLLGCNEAERPEFIISPSGREITAVDENDREITHEQLLILCGIDSMQNGCDICIGEEAPVCLDEFAEKYGKRIYRTSESAMIEIGSDTGVIMRNSMWAYDGIALVFKVLGMMNKTGLQLSGLIEKLPVCHFAKKIIASNVAPAKLRSILPVKNNRYKNGSATAHITGLAGGRLIKIIAEAATIEAADEICAEISDKLKNPVLDIYHKLE